MTDQEIYEKVFGHTLLGMDDGKLQKLLSVSHSVKEIPGCVIEVGVYTGGSAKLLALANPERTIHLFDTFTGIPYESGPNDFHTKGDFAASEQEVRQYLSDCPNAKFYVGVFPNTWPLENIRNIAIAHCDVDMEKSAADFIEYVYFRMSLGGVMVFDDYNSPACPGVKKVVNQFIIDSGETDFEVHRTQGILYRRIV